MKTNIITFVFCLMLLSLVSYTNSHAQMQNQGHLWTMTFVPVGNGEITEFLKFFETEAKPGDVQNEYVLSTKIYTHAWGPAWTVCVMNEYKDWDGFVAAEKRYGEIFDKTYPDQSKKDEINKKWGHYLTNHTDAIVVEHPNLQK